MNKQNKHLIYILLGLTLFTWAACDKNGTPVVDKPLIESLEVGLDNSGIAHPGSVLHLDAAIVAPVDIASITLSIHPEGADGWEFAQVRSEETTSELQSLMRISYAVFCSK